MPVDKEFAKTQALFRGSWSGYERDKLFVNPDGPYPRFFDAAYVLGLDLDDDGRGAIPFDFDGDGDLDLAIQSLQGLHLFENTSPKRHFARVRLTATTTESLALGATMKLVSGGVTQQGWVKLSEGFVSQIPREMHFGLADATKIDRIDVSWPSGAKETWTDLPADRLIDLREGQAAAIATEVPHWSEETRPRAVPAFSFDLSLPRLEGGAGPVVSKGMPAVINFWAPWCLPCKDELPALVSLEKTYGKEVQFAGVNLEVKDLDSVKKAVAAFGIRWPQFVANEAIVQSFFGPEGKTVLPATFIFDATGRLTRAFLRPVVAAEVAGVLETFRENEGFSGDYKRRGLEELARGRFEEAEKLFRKYLALRPESPNPHCLLGLALMGLRRPEEALTELQLAVKIDPDFIPVAYFNIGNALRQLNRPAEAVPSYEKASKLKGYDPQILKALALAYGESGKPLLGIPPLDRVLQVDPNDAEAWSLKGKMHLVARSAVPSREAFGKALALDPNNADACLGYAQALFLEGRPADALKAAKEALRLDPNSSEVKRLIQALQQ